VPAVNHGTPTLYAQRPKVSSKKSRSTLALTYLLVQSGNEAGVIIIFLLPVTNEDTVGAISQRIPAFTYPVRMNLESIVQFGYYFFTFSCLQGYPDFE
jgi:hypothetical protein